MSTSRLRDSGDMLISLLVRLVCALVLLGVSSALTTAKVIDNPNTSPTSTPAGITVLVLNAPATITLSATASDADGTINRVEFYAGASLIGTSTTPPYSVTWTPLASGPHTLTAKAFDNLETNTVSAPVNVTVTGAITYLHNDFAGNPIAATDAAGTILWKENFRPYGDRLNNPPAAATNRQWFHGKAVDSDTGLSYFGARYYDPTLGRFMGTDPQHFTEDNLHSFNRYAYGNDNPYRFIDPKGNSPVDVIFWAADAVQLAVAINTGVGVGGAAVDFAISTAALFSPIPGAGQAVKAARAAGNAGDVVKGGTEIVQRAMSRAELESIQKTGILSRGGRDGPHHVSDAVNSDANRARQRISLDRTPEVRTTLEVPSGTFSSPSKVAPKNNMPGGGIERTAAGNIDIPVKIRHVDSY